jgi:hypothetical protein
MKRGFLDLLDPSNDPEFFGRLYRDHPVYMRKSIYIHRLLNALEYSFVTRACKIVARRQLHFCILKGKRVINIKKLV